MWPCESARDSLRSPCNLRRGRGGSRRLGRARRRADRAVPGEARRHAGGCDPRVRPALELRRRDVTCLASWSGLGVRISFYNLGGQDPCQGRYGYFGEGIITGRGWATGKGLRIGDPARRVSALYGQRRVSGAWAWLLTRRSPFGDGGVYAALSARIHHGRVTAFRVKYQAGGD